CVWFPDVMCSRVNAASIPGCFLGLLLGMSGILAVACVQTARGASADLWQARNGPPDLPTSPVDWVKGNPGPFNAHLVEGYSVPYRLVMTGLSPGRHALVIEWDTRQGGKNAIDYLTHYDRLTPHNQFGAHTNAEIIRPLDGLSGAIVSSNSFPIPEPATNGTSVAGQPAASFRA